MAHLVLTDAPLDYGTPIDDSRCGECQECQKACPSKAINGNLWNVALSRDNIFTERASLVNLMNCAGFIMKYNEKLGVNSWEARICGVCMAACPRTKRYVSRDNFKDASV